MKLCIILLVLAVGSQGFLLNELKETFGKIGDAFTATFQTVGEQAKTVGQGLLETLKQQGTELAGQAVQSKNFTQYYHVGPIYIVKRKPQHNSLSDLMSLFLMYARFCTLQRFQLC